MIDWRPLSKRGEPDPRLDEPTEGLPPYLAGPMVRWVESRFTSGQDPTLLRTRLEAFQLAYKLDPPLYWRDGVNSALDDLLTRVYDDEEFGLDVIDYVLAHMPEFVRYESPSEAAQGANAVLWTGGSAWEVTPKAEEGRFQLSRRAVGPVRDAIQAIPAGTRAHQHLITAWNRLSGRNPDPSSGYREAVRAVEAAAKPVVLPDNDRATLGQMIVAMRDKPEKWTVTLGNVDDVRRIMEIVWTSQLDRHGTDDDSVPLTVSPDEADAAFAACLHLARLFAGGHVAAC